MQYNNFSIENNNNFCYLVYNIEDVEKIDKVEHNMITNNKIEGLLNTIYSSIDDKYFYKYDISSKIPLKRYISRCNDRDKIVKVLLNALNVFLETEDFLILKEHIILDENYIFVDVSDISLHFVCLPIYNNNKCNMKVFINNIIDNLNFDDFENKNLIYLLKDVINKEDLINFREVSNVLKNLDHSKNFIKQEKVNKEEKKIEIECDILNNTQKRNIKKLIDGKTAKEKKDDVFDFLVPGKEEKEEKVKVKKADNKLKIDIKNIFMVTKRDKKSIAKEKKPEKIHEVDIKVEKDEDAAYNHTVLIKSANSNEQTSLLHALNSGLYPTLPYLIRKKNNEKINIISDLFRVGKEIDYVDYAIKDNNTISRAHADIIKINKDYYIQDNNSKNHTYVNDNMIRDGQAVKLEHNYEITLSDEVFIFKLY